MAAHKIAKTIIVVSSNVKALEVSGGWWWDLVTHGSAASAAKTSEVASTFSGNAYWFVADGEWSCPGRCRKCDIL